MIGRDFASRPGLLQLLLAGALAGVTSALLNALYFLAYRAATGLSVREPTLGSIAASSLLPSLLAALGYFGLTRLTRRAPAIFVAITAAITIASFESIFRNVLPDGSPKPAGFDGLVMPMHLAVGLAAALLIPRWAARPQSGSRWCASTQPGS